MANSPEEQKIVSEECLLEGFDPNHYEKPEKLATGSFGVVFKMNRLPTIENKLKLPESIAMKNVPIRDSDGSNIREYLILKQCKHENILKLFYRKVTKVPYNVDHLLLYSELCDANLRQFVSENDLSRDNIKSLFSQMIKGIQYLHSIDVVHRDIKPENLLVNYKNVGLQGAVLKIADFGLARFLPADINSSFVHTACGSLKYASPELVSARNNNTSLVQTKFPCSTDIFSLGVVMYEVIAKQLPFSIKDLGQTSFNGESLIKKHIEKSMLQRDLIQMLQWDPSKRPEAKELGTLKRVVKEKEYGDVVVTFHVLVAQDFGYNHEAGDGVYIVFGPPVGGWDGLYVEMTPCFDSEYANENKILYLKGNYLLQRTAKEIDIPYKYVFIRDKKETYEFMNLDAKAPAGSNRCLFVPNNLGIGIIYDNKGFDKYDDIVCHPPLKENDLTCTNNRVNEYRDKASLCMLTRINSNFIKTNGICKSIDAVKDIFRSHDQNGQKILLENDHCGYLNSTGYIKALVAKEYFAILLKQFQQQRESEEADINQLRLAIFLFMYLTETEIEYEIIGVITTLFIVFKNTIQVVEGDALKALLPSNKLNDMIGKAIANAVHRYMCLLDEDTNVPENLGTWVYTLPLLLKVNGLHFLKSCNAVEKWKMIEVDKSELLSELLNLANYFHIPDLATFLLDCLSWSAFGQLLSEKKNLEALAKLPFQAVLQKYLSFCLEPSKPCDALRKEVCTAINALFNTCKISSSQMNEMLLIIKAALENMSLFLEMEISCLLRILAAANMPKKDIHLESYRVLLTRLIEVLEEMPLDQQLSTYNQHLLQANYIDTLTRERLLQNFQNCLRRHSARECLLQYLHNDQCLHEEVAAILFDKCYEDFIVENKKPSIVLQTCEKNDAALLSNEAIDNVVGHIQKFVASSCNLEPFDSQTMLKFVQSDIHKNMFRLLRHVPPKTWSTQTEMQCSDICKHLLSYSESLLQGSVSLEHFKGIADIKKWNRLTVIYTIFQDMFPDTIYSFPTEKWRQDMVLSTDSFSKYRDALQEFLIFLLRLDAKFDKKGLQRKMILLNDSEITVAATSSIEMFLGLSLSQTRDIHWLVTSRKQSIIVQQLFGNSLNAAIASKEETLGMDSVIPLIPEFKDSLKQLVQDLANSSIKLRTVDVIFREHYNHRDNNALLTQIEVLRDVADGPRIEKWVINQICWFFELKKYKTVAREIKELCPILGITKVFSVVETILEASEDNQAFIQKPLSFITDDLLDNGAKFSKWSKGEIKCLRELHESEECRNFFAWVKNNFGSLRQLTILVDLARKNNGTERIWTKEDDGITKLKTAINGYAPLIFDLKDDCTISHFLDACAAIFRNLRDNKSLPKYIRDSRQIMVLIRKVHDSYNSSDAVQSTHKSRLSTMPAETEGKHAKKSVYSRVTCFFGFS